MEVAAGVVAAEQVISTTIEGGAVAGYAIAQPTVPLKATFSRIGTTPQGDAGSPDSLARSHHTLTHLTAGNSLYIYGGLVSSGTQSAILAGPEMHILKLSAIDTSTPQYKSVPALARDNSPVPSARAAHTAVAVNGKVAVFGGYSDVSSLKPLSENSRVWLFDPETLHWSCLEATNGHGPTRHSHGAVHWRNNLIIHGGIDADGKACNDTWRFDIESRTWTELPSSSDQPGSAPLSDTAPPNIAVADDTLYILDWATDNLSSAVHTLDLPSATSPQPSDASDPASPPTTTATWSTTTIPTNPLTPGPSARNAGALLPITTGMGRTYLLLLFGAALPPTHPSQPYLPDAYTLQLPSATPTPAAAKDSARSAIPHLSTGSLDWSPVTQIAANELPTASWLESSTGPARSWVRESAAGAAGWVSGHVRSLSSHAAAPAPGANEAALPAEASTADVAADMVAANGAGESAKVSAGAGAQRHAGDVDGKAHPGPRGYFGAAVVEEPVVGIGMDGATKSAGVVIWGGVNGKGEVEGDGWMIGLKV